MPRELAVHWVVGDLDAGSVVLPDHGWVCLLPTEALQHGTEVDDLLPAHAGSHVLCLCRAQRDAVLAFRLPGHRGIVHAQNIA
eukprot:2311785-Rhodomonas_salina.1